MQQRQDEIPPEVRGFITQTVGSVVQLEILLLLHGAPQREWTADEVARNLKIDRAWAEGQLQSLCEDRLAQCLGDPPPPRYRFAPADPVVARAVDGLAKAYAERRVTVISLIFAKPPDPLRAFSDAFRFRKKDEPGHG